MRVICRNFNPSNNDFELMWKLLKEDYNDRQEGWVWLFSRLEYWRFGIWHDKKYIPTFWSKNAQLWFDSFGNLLGFAISEEGDEMFTIIIRKKYEYLYKDILNWVKKNWKNRGKLRIEINSFEGWKKSILEEAGFNVKKHTCTTRKYDIEEAISIKDKLDDGYSFQDMATSGDYKGKLQCTSNAFRGRQPNDFDILVNEYFIQAPSYNPYLSISIVNDEGQHVSSCIGWADYDNSVSEIETICTHSDFRRTGLAEAVIKECLTRLYGLGIKYTYITGWNDITNGLYEKIGPISKTEWYLYEV